MQNSPTPPEQKQGHASAPDQNESDRSTQGDESRHLEQAIHHLEELGDTEADAPRVQALLRLVARYFRGPIPPAEMLAEYDRIQPGLAKQIIGWTEKQQSHRQHLEIVTTQGSERRQDRSQTYAFVVAVAGILGAATVGIFGNWVAAAFIVVACVGGPATASILARWLDRSLPSPDSKSSGDK